MRALKALVIGMGAELRARPVVVTIASRTLDGGNPPSEAAFAVPAGAEVVETALDGDRMALRLRLADGTTTIHVFDLATGMRVGVARIEDGG